jgi:hypothetical protein
MPPRRTSPRRTVTRPTVVYDADEPLDDESGRTRFAAAAPWIAVLALIVAAGGVVLGLMNRGVDLSACRSAAWAAVPDSHDLPKSWTLGSTDLNANGMTVSILGPAPADGSTSGNGSSQQPVAYASVTCYGDVAATAMQQNRAAAEAAGDKVVDRSSGGDAYDVVSASNGSVTTLFRVGGLIAQIADAGTADTADLAGITKAVAAAMGDRTAPGDAGPLPSDLAAGSAGPNSSDELGSAEPSGTPVAPDLEAKLPSDIGGTPLTTQSATADTVFGTDPNGRALSARIRALGSDFSKLQVAQAFDDSGTVDISIVAFRLPGKDIAKVREAIVDTWLSANAAGVKQSQVTLGGKSLLRIDYGDEGPLDYVYTGSDYVVVIDTSDVSIATEAASKIK